MAAIDLAEDFPDSSKSVFHLADGLVSGSRSNSAVGSVLDGISGLFLSLEIQEEEKEKKMAETIKEAEESKQQ